MHINLRTQVLKCEGRVTMLAIC